MVIAGQMCHEGDVVAKETILRREPGRLGSLLRKGHIEEIVPKSTAKPNFKGMTKKAIKKYAEDHSIEIPESVVKVDDMREFMSEYVKGE